MTTEIKQPKHYKYGGSKIELIKLCPGSPKAQEPFADRPAGPAADRGTRIHEHMEHALTSGLSALHMSGGKEAKEANIGILAARKIVEIANEHGFSAEELRAEKQLPSGIHPEAGGTPDVAAARAFHDMLMFDLKTGSRFVTVEDNYQLIFYALCFWLSLDEFTRMSLNMVHCIIIQPEAEPPHEVHVRKWSFPAAKLSEYQAEITRIISLSESQPDLRVPGEHCEGKYCAARTSCAAYTNWLNEQSDNALQQVFEGMQPTAGRGEALARQLRALPFLEAFVKAVKEEAKQQIMLDSNSIPGFGAQDSYGNRTYTDEKAVIKLAKELKLKPDEFQPRSLLSPAQFENLLKAKIKEADAELKKAVADLSAAQDVTQQVAADSKAVAAADRKTAITSALEAIPGLVERPYTGVKVVEKKTEDIAELFAGQIQTA